MLACPDCGAVHDVDLAPDTGSCVVCGGALVEDPSERPEVGAGAFNKGLAEVVELMAEDRPGAFEVGVTFEVQIAKPKRN